MLPVLCVCVCVCEIWPCTLREEQIQDVCGQGTEENIRT